MYWELIAIFNLLKIRMRADIFGTEKCKVTFSLKYIIEKDEIYPFFLTLRETNQY